MARARGAAIVSAVPCCGELAAPRPRRAVMSWLANTATGCGHKKLGIKKVTKTQYNPLNIHSNYIHIKVGLQRSRKLVTDTSYKAT